MSLSVLIEHAAHLVAGAARLVDEVERLQGREARAGASLRLSLLGGGDDGECRFWPGMAHCSIQPIQPAQSSPKKAAP